MSSKPYTQAFFDAQSSGSLSSARAVLGELFAILGGPPPRVVDIGCGLGTWLRAALELGTESVRGLDGGWLDQNRLEIPAESFTVCDLAQWSESGSLPLDGGRFDLTISVEVAEHLPAQCARGFIRLLCQASDLIVFSAALPYQGGVDHVNEDWPSAWAALFREQGYACFDILRDAVWLRADVDWWYAQNVLVFARGERHSQLMATFQPVKEPLPRIHPRKYLLQVAAELELRQALTAATAAPFPAIMPLPPYIAPLERKVAALRSALATQERTSEPISDVGALIETVSLYDKLRAQAFEWLQELSRARQESARLENELNALRHGRQSPHAGFETAELQGRLQAALNDAAEARRVLAAALSSTSWKITAPLRAAGKLVRSALVRQKP